MYHIRVANDYLVFSAAHFITFDGGVCEALHGHDYHVSVEVGGGLDENHYVVDYLMVQDVLKLLLRQLDHGVLLPTGHPLIRVAADEREVTASFGERRWVFPRCDCRLLEVPNTTTELIAQWIATRLQTDLAARTGRKPARLRLEITEGYGHTAGCELRAE